MRVAETQEHILNQCPDIHKDDKLKVYKKDIFAKEIDKLREAAQKLVVIDRIIKQKLKEKETTTPRGACDC